MTQAELLQIAANLRKLRDAHRKKADEHLSWFDLLGESITYLEQRAELETRPAHVAAHDCACKECVAAETRVHPEGSCLLGGDCDHIRETPVVPKGHFWRGIPELNRHWCRNCGEHYDKHLHTDEASRCPETRRDECPVCHSTLSVSYPWNEALGRQREQKRCANCGWLAPETDTPQQG